MKITKRLALILLAAVILLPLMLTSCDGDTPDESKAGGASSASESEEFTQATGLEPKNWGGETVKFIAAYADNGYYNREIASNQVEAEKYSGEHVFDAVVQREREMEDKFGIKIEVHFAPEGKTPSDVIRDQIQGGSNEYQILADALLNIAKMGVDSQLYSVDKLGIDTTKDFWDQTAIKDLSVANKVFYLTGDAVVSDDQSTWCCFFNKDLIVTNDLENPYDLVKNNQWTIDKIAEMGKVYSAYNSSVEGLSWENGHYGLVAQTYDGITSMCGMNEKMITKDADDLPMLNLKQSIDMPNKFSKVYDLLKDEQNSIMAEFIQGNDDKYAAANSIFFDGRALFQYQKVEHVLSLAQQKVNFGIVPMPKYTSEQENYNTTCTVYWSLFLGVPRSVPESDLELVSYTLQLMGYLGQKYLTPAYYDTTIKTQKAPDPESEEMLDLIFSHRVYDLATVYNYTHAIGLYTAVLCSSSNTFASTVDTYYDQIQSMIDETVETVTELE